VNTKLQSLKSFLHSVEGSYRTWLLRPYNQNVRLHDGTIVTVPVFNMKEMLTSLLTDQTIMVDTNFADGYDVLTGYVDVNYPSNDKYGEVHTGDAWIPARDRYCSNPQDPTMTVGIIVFGDKSHTNLHGKLSLTPIIFTLTLFNQTARNNIHFGSQLGTYQIFPMEKGQQTVEVQVISYKTNIHVYHAYLNHCTGLLDREDLLGRNVTVKIWIHYLIGDTERNNNWLGQYPGNRDGVQRPYHDSKCSFGDLKKHEPKLCLHNIRQHPAG
jgi:hypothetical protein